MRWTATVLTACILAGCSSSNQQRNVVETEKGLMSYDTVTISQAIDTVK